MRTTWSSLLFCAASLLVVAPVANAQAVYTADSTTRIQAGAGLMGLNPDYAASPIYGLSAWADYDFSKYLGVELAAHLGEFITPGDITENSYFVGPRIIYRRHKLTGYGKLMIGRATITNTAYDLSSSYNVYAYGGGIEYKLLRKINLRVVDFEKQSWPDFKPNALSPVAITIGASYIIH